MLYFKNPELAKLHHVTLRTVLNWIEAAKQGKLDLALHTENGKSYVANTARNVATIKQLVEERRKYRNSRAVKVVTPRPEFYKLYTEAQIYDIVTNLEIHHEIPRQYNYFDGGAGNWDRYANRLYNEETPNILTSTQKLLDKNGSYIDHLLEGCTRVNVVDIGVGNGLPVKLLLTRLLEKGIMGRYIAIDLSNEILDIAQRNIAAWFGPKVYFEGYELDMNYDRFANILAEEYLREDSDTTLNLILVLGGTLSNLRNPDGAFRTIHDSLGGKDLLVHTDKLDSATSRKFFDFNIRSSEPGLAPNHRLIFDLLQIDDTFYDVEMGFDEKLRQRYIRVRLKVALKIKFDFNIGQRILEFNKGDTILLWRAWVSTSMDIIRQLDRNDYYLLHSSQTNDQEYILTVSRVKTDSSI